MPRSTVPAITHLDNSARIQTIRREDNPLSYDIIRAFEALTGCSVIVNTSFNVRDEPIVCTPEDAYRCFLKTRGDESRRPISSFAWRAPGSDGLPDETRSPGA